jgi:tripartite-type tricarboxylate transporter receptor subunit TctC
MRLLKRRMRLLKRRALITMALITLCQPAGAQDYPSRPVTIVVPFAPGGSTDLLSRMVGQKLEQRWGKTFVIENKPGAASLVAASAVAKANPDGYTLMMAPSATMSTNVTLYKSLPYDPVAELVPLAVIAQTPFVLVVNPSLPVHSVQDFIKWAKEQGGQLSYATVGPGQPHHLFAELFKSMTGVEMSPVPYRGSLPALNDVVAGHVPVMFVDLGAGLSIIQSGKVRALGVSPRTRVAAIPDVPSVAEAGVPDFDAASWQMLVAPAKSPRPVVDKLHAEIKSILALGETKDFIVKGGMLTFENPSVEGLQDFVKSEIVRWGKVVHQAGVAGSQ